MTDQDHSDDPTLVHVLHAATCMGDEAVTRLLQVRIHARSRLACHANDTTLGNFILRRTHEGPNL